MTHVKVPNPSLLNARVRKAREAWLAAQRHGKVPSLRLGRFSSRTVRGVLVLTILCLGGAIALLVFR